MRWMKQGFRPLIKVTLYVLDYVKDSWFFVYLYGRLQFINDRCYLLTWLVYLYGASIGVAEVFMGIIFQTDNAVLGFDSSWNRCSEIFVRILFFFLTPFVPVIVVMKSIQVKVAKKTMKDDWKTTLTSATQKYEKYEKWNSKHKSVVEAYSDLQMVESNVESFVQFTLLLTFTVASACLPRTSGLGLIEDDSTYTKIFLAWSFLETYKNIIEATIDATNLRKKGQMGIFDQVIVGLSTTFQLLAHLLLMVPIGLLALPRKDQPAEDGSDDPSLTPAQAVFLVVTPIVFRWVSILCLHYYVVKNKTGLREMLKGSYLRKIFLHLISNTGVTMPWRSGSETQQVHRGSEIRWSLALTGFSIMGTWTLATSMMKTKSPRILPKTNFTSINEFLLLAALPALVSHLLGCAFLLVHYQCLHPWRPLFKWQQRQEKKKELDEETPSWEQVGSRLKILHPDLNNRTYKYSYISSTFENYSLGRWRNFWEGNLEMERFE